MSELFNKYKVPLNILEMLEPYFNKTSDLYQTTITNDGTITFTFIVKESGFFFKIDGSNLSKVKDQVFISYAPGNSASPYIREINVKPDSIKNFLEKWEQLIVRYRNANVPEFDVITESYESDFDEEFSFVEDETMNRPLKDIQLVLLFDWLKRIQLGLPEYINGNNEEIVNEVAGEINVVTENLTHLTKREVIKKIKKIWAKLTKAGVPVIKEFLNEIKKEAFKQIIKGGLEVGNDLIHLLK